MNQVRTDGKTGKREPPSNSSGTFDELLARMSHYRAKRHLAIREPMRGKAEGDPRGERIGIGDRADGSVNTASRACRFEVSAEQFPKDTPYLAESQNLLPLKPLYPFSRNR